MALICCLLFLSHIISTSAGWTNYTQKPNNSFPIFAFRPWSLDAYVYGGFFGHGDVRTTDWRAGDVENDIYFATDLTDKKIYLLDEINGGDFYIKKIDPFCIDNSTNFWCVEKIYQCNDTGTVCQQQALTSWNQAVAFDEDTRLFWWVGRPSSSGNYGWFSFNVDTRGDPIFHDWGIWNSVRQLANARIYKGYLFVVEKLDHGLVRYNLSSTDGERTVIIGLNDTNLTGATWQNLGAFTFDPATDLLYFSVHDNYRMVPAVIISRSWDQMTTAPYTEYQLGYALPFEIRGMAVNPGKELFYITDDGDHANTISKLIIGGSDVKYPPFPRSELLDPSSQYISKSIDVIPGTMLEYAKLYPTDITHTYTIDNPQDWYDGQARLIWMEFNGAFYNAAIRQAKNIAFGEDFVGDKINVWERTGVTAQRFSSIYLDLERDRIWYIDPQEQYMRILYLDFADNLVHEYYLCPYAVWFTLPQCTIIFPVCNADTCSLTTSGDIMYFVSQGNSYFMNMTHFEQVDPRYGPQKFEWGQSIYNSGKLIVYGDYLYLAASEYGIFRKSLTTIGVDSSSELVINKTDFSNALIKCFIIDETRNIIYICAGSKIYYDSFDISTPTGTRQVTSSTVTQLNIATDSSGVSGTIYSLAINDCGTTLYFQFSTGSDTFMLNWPTPFGITTAGPYKHVLYSTGSSTKPQGFTFYYPSNNMSYTRTCDNDPPLDKCQWDNIFCYNLDLTSETNIVNIQELVNINSKGYVAQIYVYLTSNGIDCYDPTITYQYEKIDFDTASKYMDVKVNNMSGALIEQCGAGVISDSCNIMTSCFTDRALSNINVLMDGQTYTLYFYKTADGYGNCYSPDRSIKGTLTAKCLTSPPTTPSPTSICSASNTFCKYVNMTTSGVTSTQFTKNLKDAISDSTIYYVYFTVNGGVSCSSPLISFKYEGMWYSGDTKKIDVYTEYDGFTTAVQTCSNPSTTGCSTNTPNNDCITSLSVNGGNDIVDGDTFIVKVVKADVGNQCSGSPTRNINADITFYCDAPSTPTPTTANPTTANPTTANLTTANPTTANPTTANPTSANPTTDNPTTANPTTANPTTDNPATANPTTANPTTANPTTANPTTANPTTANPTTANPTTANPTTANPTTANPTTANATTVATTSANPTTANPTTDNPTTANPTTANPTTANATSVATTSAATTTQAASGKTSSTSSTSAVLATSATSVTSTTSEKSTSTTIEVADRANNLMHFNINIVILIFVVIYFL